ncbi:MAG: transcriptional regulator [Actinobacteria bacterium HGW-Actinobacteria-4]|nr:MAG: transcriptional regulator [Actinobacteria bacterium HGW-Actinobacteria-4]
MKLHGGLTQVELAGATGLSPATVSNIVKELVSSNVLHTTHVTRSGRRAVFVTLARALGLVAGVHVSARHLRVAIADIAHTVIAEHHLPLAQDHRSDNELARTALLIADMLESVDASMEELQAVGIAMPAPINIVTGTISRSGIMRGWEAVPVAEVLQRSLNKPVFVDNDCNLGALAEYRGGALRAKEDSVYLNISEGIGAGIIINGRLLRGHHGSAGEFGHITIDERGDVCRCGNRGCLETFVGGPALIAKLRTGNRGLKLHDIVTRAVGGDARFVRAVADAGRHIGVAAANLCNLVDPERVVVGGELAQAGELLLGPIRHSLERSVLVPHDSLPEVVQGQLGLRAEVLGAVGLAIDQVSLVSRS